MVGEWSEGIKVIKVIIKIQTVKVKIMTSLTCNVCKCAEAKEPEKKESHALTSNHLVMVLPTG